MAQTAEDQAAFRSYQQLCSQVQRGTWEMRTTLCAMLEEDAQIVKTMIAAQVGINYSCAQFLLPFFGISASNLNLAIAFALILVTQGAINHWGVRLVAVLNDFSVTVHIAGVLILVGVLFWVAPKQPVSFLFEAVNSTGQHYYWWAFL